MSEDTRLNEWVQRWWRDAYFSPLAVSHAQVEDAIRVVYRVLDAPPPPIVWVASPAAQIIPAGIGTARQRVLFERDFSQQALIYQERLEKMAPFPEGGDPGFRRSAPFSSDLGAEGTRFLDMYLLALRESVRDPRVNPMYVQNLAYLVTNQWVRCQIALITEGLDDPVSGHAASSDVAALGRALATLMRTTFFTVFSAACLVCKRPSIVPRLDGQRFRLDNPVGPAIEFPDGFSKYYLQGLEFDSEVVMYPERMDPQTIFEEINQERRRIRLERFGLEKFITEVEAETVDNDRFGILYRVRFDQGDDLQMVKVINATPEPDGTQRNFFLRVPPWVNSSKAAVAWTFDLDENEYQPEFES